MILNNVSAPSLAICLGGIGDLTSAYPLAFLNLMENGAFNSVDALKVQAIVIFTAFQHGGEHHHLSAPIH